MIWRLAKSHLPNVQSVADQINFKPNRTWADCMLDLKGKTICWPLKHKVDDIMLISKAFDEEERMISKNSMRWRPSSGLFSVIHSKLGGYTHWVHPMNHQPPKDRMLISKAWDENKTMLTSKAWVEDKNDFWKNLRWRPSSELFSIIHSKLGGYTRCT